MRFRKTLNLWQPGALEDLRSGRLRLQVGQWVRCGPQRPSRFVAVKRTGVVWAVHPEGDRGVTNARFRALIDCHDKRS